jgi:hypothetical protein
MLLRNEGLWTEGTRDFDGMWPKTDGASALITFSHGTNQDYRT